MTLTINALEVADALRLATDRAANLLEKLEEANERMRSASLGNLPDGTPVEDMLEDLKETRARESSLRALVQTIKYHTGAKSVDASKALKAIRELIAQDRTP